MLANKIIRVYLVLALVICERDAHIHEHTSCIGLPRRLNQRPPTNNAHTYSVQFQQVGEAEAEFLITIMLLINARAPVPWLELNPCRPSGNAAPLLFSPSPQREAKDASRDDCRLISP